MPELRRIKGPPERLPSGLHATASSAAAPMVHTCSGTVSIINMPVTKTYMHVFIYTHFVGHLVEMEIHLTRDQK